MARDVRIAILGDARDFSRATRSASDDADRLGRNLSRAGGHFQKWGKALAFGAGAVAVAGAALGKSFVDAAIESQKVTKQTEAVIKSMGGASKVTAKEVAKLSQKLSLKTGVDDELIQSGQNLLLTFGKVRNEVGKGNKVFDRATEAALDMSVAMGTDMKSASIQVGKALNDPIKGITALTRVGVSFTQQQKDQIKALVESGDVLGAQKIILAELERQFGGSAEAQATAIDKLKVAWGNISEELGAVLLPVVEAVAAWLAEHLPSAMETFRGWIDSTLKPALEDVRVWFETYVLPAMGTVVAFVRDTLIPKLQDLVDWMKDAQWPITVFATIVGTVLVGAMAAYATSAIIAAGATIAATWPVWLAVAAVAALAAGLYHLTHNEGEGFLDWLVRMAAYTILFGQIVIDFFKTLWGWAQSAWSMVKNVVDALKTLASVVTNMPSLPAIGGGGGLFSLPFLAEGGPVTAGSPYVVGEKGPELFIPRAAGSIVPNHQMGRGSPLSSGSGSTIVIQVGDREVARLYADGKVRAERRGVAA